MKVSLFWPRKLKSQYKEMLYCQTLSKIWLTILSLNKNCRPLLKISSLPLPELCVFTFYLKSTNLITQVDPSFLLAVVPPNLFPAIWTKLWHISSKLYRLTLRTANTHLKFFVTLVTFLLHHATKRSGGDVWLMWGRGAMFRGQWVGLAKGSGTINHC